MLAISTVVAIFSSRYGINVFTKQTDVVVTLLQKEQGTKQGCKYAHSPGQEYSNMVSLA